MQGGRCSRRRLLLRRAGSGDPAARVLERRARSSSTTSTATTCSCRCRCSLLGVGLVTMLRRREIRITQTRLLEYASAGWFNPAEVASLATPTGRRHARAWAKAHGVSAAMKSLHRGRHAPRVRARADRRRSRSRRGAGGGVGAAGSDHGVASRDRGRSRRARRGHGLTRNPSVNRLIAQWRVKDSDSSGR